ncbi:MAG: serine protease [Gammaproteobacteria bacterium]|nr:serine protease [Gammaproteobacteria bacterium]
MKQKRIQVDKNIERGMSGGVVVDTDGSVIGVAATGTGIGAFFRTNGSFIPVDTMLGYLY